MKLDLIVLYALAALFGFTGFIKISRNKQKLAKLLPWTKLFKPATIKFIGFSEFSAALGLAGPKIIGFGEKLTPYAGLGICIIMVLAGIFHSRRKEYSALIVNIILFIPAAYIAFNF
jgi:hypothetical protein